MGYDKRCHFFVLLTLPFRVNLIFLQSAAVYVRFSLPFFQMMTIESERFFLPKIRPFASFVSNVFRCFWRLTMSQNATHKHVHGKPNIYIYWSLRTFHRMNTKIAHSKSQMNCSVFPSLSLSKSLSAAHALFLANPSCWKEREINSFRKMSNASRMLSLTRHYGFHHRPSIGINW